MSVSETRLQEVVESIATHRLPDGTWHLDQRNATKFYNMILPYIRHSAYLSDKHDPDNACGEICEHVWKALKRYGPRYQNKPFKNLLKMKVNNVLTNLHNQKHTKKREGEKFVTSLDYLAQERVNDDQGTSYGRYASISPGQNAFNNTYVDALDLTSVTESLTKKQIKELERATKRENGMPHKLTMEEIMYYVKRLPNEEKQQLLLDIWALVSGVSIGSVRKILSPIKSSKEENNNDASQYNNSCGTKINFGEKDKLKINFSEVLSKEPNEEHFMPEKAYVEIGSGDIGQQFITQFNKKIEIVNKSSKMVRVLIMATDEEIDVPHTYMVLPLELATTATEMDPVEASMQETPEEEVTVDEGSTVELDTDEDDDLEYLADVEEEEATDDEEPEEVVRVEAEEKPEPPKRKPGRPKSTETAAKPAKKPRKATAEGDAPKKRGRPAKKAADGSAPKKQTAKSLVIELLKQKAQTRDSLAEAIIANDLTKNKNPTNVKNYVSVMITNLKKEDIGLEVVERGVWKISK